MENDNDEEKRIQLLKQKAKFFFLNNILVHVSKKDKEWLNGNIVQPLSSDFFMLEEKKKGLIPVFFLEVVDIEKYEVEK